MAKKNTTEETPEVITNEVVTTEERSADEKKESPLKAIMKSISELSQADRLVLYGRLDKLAYHDRDRFSGGLDSDPAIFEQAINSL
jgi:hypothetical protein